MLDHGTQVPVDEYLAPSLNGSRFSRSIMGDPVLKPQLLNHKSLRQRFCSPMFTQDLCKPQLVEPDYQGQPEKVQDPGGFQGSAMQIGPRVSLGLPDDRVEGGVATCAVEIGEFNDGIPQVVTGS